MKSRPVKVRKEASAATKKDPAKRRRHGLREHIARRSAFEARVLEQRAKIAAVAKYGVALAGLGDLGTALDEAATKHEAAEAQAQLKAMSARLGRKTFNSRELAELEALGVKVFLERWQAMRAMPLNEVYELVKSKLEKDATEHEKRLAKYVDLKSTVNGG